MEIPWIPGICCVDDDDVCVCYLLDFVGKWEKILYSKHGRPTLSRAINQISYGTRALNFYSPSK